MVCERFSFRSQAKNVWVIQGATMEFYHDIITEKSWQFLQELKKRYVFLLIGGWAVFLYSHSLKSKDIDVILDYSELAKLKEDYNVFKNERLKKYEIKTGEFDIDIYLPHYSELGIDIEQVKQTSVLREGFLVPAIEMLFLLKVYAWTERRGTAKGQKDELDIFGLAILPEFDWQKYTRFVKDCDFGEYYNEFIALLKRTHEVKELGLDKQKMAKLRKKILAEATYQESSFLR